MVKNRHLVMCEVTFPSSPVLGGGSPLHASEDQNLPSLLDHFTSGKQPDFDSSGSRTFSRKHHDLELSLALRSNLGNEKREGDVKCLCGGEESSRGRSYLCTSAHPVQFPRICPSRPISMVSSPSAHLHVLAYLRAFLDEALLHGGAGKRSSVSFWSR